MKSKLLLIGVDSADWEIIQTMADHGKLPAFAHLLKQGAAGPIASLRPQLSPILWTSIATGKRSEKHGIHGMVEASPDGTTVQPVTSSSRRTSALWNMVGEAGGRSIVLGWWPSHPAEEIAGVMVSNLFARATHPYGQPWPVVERSVHPSALTREFEEIRLHPQELLTEQMQEFIPRLLEIDQEKDHRPERLATSIAEAATLQGMATHLMATQEWDLAAVYFNFLDNVSHSFMRFAPPKVPWVSEADYDFYSGVIAKAYLMQDMFLAQLIHQAGPASTVCVVSDHGFASGTHRVGALPHEPAAIVREHRWHGVLCLKGPGIAQGESLKGATLLDVTPTLLHAAGLPVGDDMDGKVLLGAFADERRHPHAMHSVPTWDPAGDDGNEREPVAAPSPEMLKHLVQLGYVDPGQLQGADAIENAVNEWTYNRALGLVDAGRHEAAVRILQDLWPRQKETLRTGMLYFQSLRSLRRTDEAEVLLQEMIREKGRLSERAQVELENLRKDLPSDPLVMQKQLEEMPELAQRLAFLNARATWSFAGLAQLRGQIAADRGEHAEAVEKFREALDQGGASVDLEVSLGSSLLAMGNLLEAEAAYKRALALDKSHAAAHAGMAAVTLQGQRWLEAASFAMRAVELDFSRPEYHHYLGSAFAALGRWPRAVECWEAALNLGPRFTPARASLVRAYREVFKEPVKAEELEREGERLAASGELPESVLESTASLVPPEEIPASWSLENTVVIVSGLPRSGTSMAMQMLQAGGLPLLVDGKRVPDEGNPEGYWEYAPVMRLTQEKEWVPVARGNGLKVVSPQLRFLPILPSVRYVVIMMDRDLEQVSKSQENLLSIMGSKSGAQNMTKELALISDWSRRWLSIHSIPTLQLPHRLCVEDPSAAAQKIADFLKPIADLDASRMASVIKPSLHRIKTSA